MKIAALVGPLLRNTVTFFSRHPLPVHLSLSPALPSTISVRLRTVLQNIVRDTVKPKQELTHALLTVRSGHVAGIGEVLVEVFREGMRLCWLDHALLSCADENRLFLPTTGFRRGLHVRRRSLKPEFAKCMEARPSRPGVYTLLVLGTWSSDDTTPADSVLDDLQVRLSDSETLDGMPSNIHRRDQTMDHARQAAVSVYTSLNNAPGNDLVEALLMLGHTCCIGTERAYDPFIATQIAEAVSLARTRGEVVANLSRGVRVLVESEKYVIVFKTSVPYEEAQNSALTIVKWMKRFEQNMLPLDYSLCIPHSTPLAGFLAPFRS